MIILHFQLQPQFKYELFHIYLTLFHLFSCTSSSFLCAGTLFPRGKCCYFLRRFSWSRQTCLSKGFSNYFHDSTTELYFRSTTHQCRCYSKTKTTKYCLKHEENLIHFIHGKTKRQQILFHN